MSDRVKGFIVVLQEDIHEEDAKRLKAAMMCLRGVAMVEPSVRDASDFVNRMMIRNEIGAKIMDAVYNSKKESE